ncbi:CDP-diacylglycerol--serine O-phosphatidyltransferase [Agarivorans gilvus]|uniref:CDP-diacylglycerol--serine O-phosphatidyltransferase n=1 Tax=Agarivorans gilvus TaxID=680279 RepID=A0ABQ1I7Q5_9ALTE|nr:CDP-diacylglycerol--serine O-phosphatidyltransferase [Agarivorans gilvus]GGB21464.1 CDP-diacylglycerol--serine O-phosphatidyltransferase [Agarivorans gilvus]
MSLGVFATDFPLALPQLALNAQNIEVLHQAEQYRQKLLQLIAAARSRIYIVALYLEDDEAGRSIMDALYLAKQQRPQLEVQVMVDWHRAQRGLIGEKSAKGNAAMYQHYQRLFPDLITISGVPVSNRELFGVLHLKGSIIDDTVVYSGASLNDVYLAQGQRYRFDRYLLLSHSRLADTLVNYLDQQLLASNAVSSLSSDRPANTKALKAAIRGLRAGLQREQYRYHPQSLGPQQLAVTPMLGLGSRRNLLNNTIRRLIAHAQQHIILCTPYFNPPRSLKRELSKALRRGVKVNLIVGDKTASDFYRQPQQAFKAIHALPYLYEMNLRQFIQRKQRYIDRGLLTIELWSDVDNSFHVKGLWVDQRYNLLTGNNFNPRAWRLDLENGLLLDDPAGLMAQQNQQELENILSHTTRITSAQDLESLSAYPQPVQRLLKRISRLRADRLLKQLL